MPTVIYRSKTMALLTIPATLVPPSYTLPGNFSLKYTSGDTTASVVVHLTMGYAEAGAVTTGALDTALADRLNPAPSGAGRIPYDTGTAWTALGAGSNGQVLKLSGGLPSWQAETAYTAGTGLSLTSNAFSVIFGGTGAANTSARSDHNHTGTLVRTSGGDTITGQLTISSSGQAISATSGTTSGSAGGIDCTTAGGIGVAGHGNVGVYGETDSDGSYAVRGQAGFSSQTAVYGNAPGSYGTAVYARAVGYLGTGVSSYSYTGNALYATTFFGTGLLVNGSTYATLAAFQRYGSNVARINSYGRGYFNGGTTTTGADFAESVRVEGSAAEFEPGDVMAIDPKAPRQFALSREANSTLVAGVISTKPALLGTIHDVSAEHKPWRKEEVELGIVGIVPTKVCDEGGAVKIGDLLVAAAKPGHAKKAPPNPPAGTVMGKALAPLEKGTGKIEVLLTLR